MGWLFVIALAALAWTILWRSGRAPRAALEIIAAALVLAIAGYGWQGNPGMPGKPVSAARDVGMGNSNGEGVGGVGPGQLDAR